MIMQSVKEGDTKYYFLSLYYDSTSDWTLDFRTFGKHSIILGSYQGAEKAVGHGGESEAIVVGVWNMDVERD